MSSDRSSKDATQSAPFVPVDIGDLEHWHRNLRLEIGVREMSGDDDNERILEYHSFTSLRATDDEVPWCSSIMCWAFEIVGKKSTGSAAAKSWLGWGRQLAQPRVGCLVIFKRRGGYHVGIYEGMHRGKYMILGGNQSDAVNIKAFDPDDALGYRWPD